MSNMYIVSEMAANRREFLHSKHTHTKDMHSMLVSLKTMHKRKQYKEHPIVSSFMLQPRLMESMK